MLSRNDDRYQHVIEIARQFGIFDCIPCARAIRAFLTEQHIPHIHLQLDTGSQDPIYGRIYDDSLDELIATTGHHEGIAIMLDGQELIVDNLHPEGLPRSMWLQNLYSPILELDKSYQITETIYE